MRRLVMINLESANIADFEAYEAVVLPLVRKHGGRVEMRVRSISGDREVHLLYFPDSEAFEAYRQDPRRLEGSYLWEASRAQSEVVLVDLVEP
jgi:hypothetical protein